MIELMSFLDQRSTDEQILYSFEIGDVLTVADGDAELSIFLGLWSISICIHFLNNCGYLFVNSKSDGKKHDWVNLAIVLGVPIKSYRQNDSVCATQVLNLHRFSTSIMKSLL